ncbi:MAG TPA: hypothetical protein VKP65_26045, partial [Rhodothermales bacterium]|nr:hypothetical protein [Rhodothermales bacterium]
MKIPQRYLTVLGIFSGCLILLWGVHMFTSQHDEAVVGDMFDLQEIENEEKRGPTDPDEAIALRFFQTKDPATDTVPLERLWAANRAAERSARLPIANGLLTNVTERGPSTIGGRTRAVLWDPDVNNKVWAGGVSGGLWFTSDITSDGTSWIKVDDFWDNLAVSTMAFDPTTSGASRTYYVGTGEGFFNIDAVRGAGIFKSTDAGNNWDLLPSTENSSFHHVQKIVVTSTGVVLAATRDGIQRSTNSGTSWTKVLGNGIGSPSAGLVDNAADLEIDGNGDIYAGLGLVFGGCDGVYKSTNGGVNWTKQSLPGGCDYGRIEIATSPLSADTIYVATQNSNLANPAVNHIFKTTNGGTSWTSPGAAPAAGGQAWYDLILSVDPNNATHVYLGVVTLWRSTTGAASWSQINGTGIHVDHHAITYKPGSSDEVVFGNDGGVYYTTNAASKNGSAVPTVIDRNDDYNVTQYYGGDIHPTSGSNVMIGGTQDNSTHRFSSPGIGPVTSPSPLNCCDGGFAFIDQTNPNIVVGSIQNGAFFRSTNGGVSF